jgi:hypothetical protein
MGGYAKMGLKYMECKGVELFHVVQDRNPWLALVNIVKNIRVA